MSDLLHRHKYDSRRQEIRRIAIAVVLILATSGTWYAVRPFLVCWAARSSVGWLTPGFCEHPGRHRLLAAALRASNPCVPEDRDLFGEDWSHLDSHCLPRPGWVAWPSGFKERRNPDGSYMNYFARFNYADHRLHAKGGINWPWLPDAPPGDMDGDGRWELVICDSATEDDEDRYVSRGAVVRLGETRNEIAWIGLVDSNLWAKTATRVKPIWRDEDHDGRRELVLVTVVYVVLPGGRGSFQPPKTVAVFEWDSPGGTLVPRHLPDDCGILPWTPPGGRPVPIAPDEELEPVLGDLHPLPEDFGTRWNPPSLPPTSTPAQ